MATTQPTEKCRIVLATPHARHDRLERVLRERADLDVLRIRSPEEFSLTVLKAFAPRYVFFPHWSWRIPAEIHEAYECVIFHMTDLPFGRGGSPLQNLIVRGIEQTRLTALRCVDELDAGPLYIQRPLSLNGTAEEILLRAAELMEEMLLAIIHDQPEPCMQQGEPVMFRRRTPADSDIRGLKDLSRVFDYIRMLDGQGYPAAFIETESLRFEFTQASLRSDEVLAQVRITRK